MVYLHQRKSTPRRCWLHRLGLAEHLLRRCPVGEVYPEVSPPFPPAKKRQRGRRVIVACDHCGKEYERLVRKLIGPKNQYCSRQCASDALRTLTPDQVAAYNKQYRRAYHQRHRDQALERVEQWRMENPEKRQAIQRRYRIKHAAALRVRNAERYAMKSGAGFIAAQWEAMLTRYDHRCLCCGRQDVSLEMDHIVPVVRGGPHEEGNIQPLCRSCNARKGVKVIDYRAS